MALLVVLRGVNGPALATGKLGGTRDKDRPIADAAIVIGSSAPGDATPDSRQPWARSALIE
jgi:hypothetical protein